MKITNQKIIRDLKERKPLKLHLGAGEKRLNGFYNVDLVELPGVDILADLNEPFDQLPDRSVNRIYSRHTFEHIDNLMGLLSEIHRICQPEAEITIIVPHFSNPYYYSDPTHVRTFGLYTFNYFVDPAKQPSIRKVPAFYSPVKFKVKSIKIEFYRRSLLERIFVPLVSKIVNLSFSTQNLYERRWSWIMPAWQITYVISPEK